MTGDAGIANRITAVRLRIARAAERAGRDPSEVTLIGVSKTHDASAVAAAYEAGLHDFGENRVQEAAPKAAELRAQGVAATWHMVGHLQTNKVRAALECFDILHSVDSERLAVAVSRAAPRPIRILIEVNVAGEASKRGVAPAEAAPLAERIGALANLDVLGLMTVAPMADDPEEVRPAFRELCRLRDAIGLRDLSMGMTDDYEVAVEEGATLVRVGRAIFGPRSGGPGETA